MRFDKPRFRYLAALTLCIPLLGAAIGLLAGLLGVFILRAFHVLNHRESVFICIYFVFFGLVLGIIMTVQKIRQALRVFRDCDQIESKKV